MRYQHDWASVSSDNMQSHIALRECIDELKDRLEGERPGLITAFFGTQHLTYGSTLAKEISKQLNPRVSMIVGCVFDLTEERD